jgi:hypothetical protein
MEASEAGNRQTIPGEQGIAPKKYTLMSIDYLILLL